MLDGPSPRSSPPQGGAAAVPCRPSPRTPSFLRAVFCTGRFSLTAGRRRPCDPRTAQQPDQPAATPRHPPQQHRAGWRRGSHFRFPAPANVQNSTSRRSHSPPTTPSSSRGLIRGRADAPQGQSAMTGSNSQTPPAGYRRLRSGQTRSRRNKRPDTKTFGTTVKRSIRTWAGLEINRQASDICSPRLGPWLGPWTVTVALIWLRDH
jgi:hypothetical protein